MDGETIDQLASAWGVSDEVSAITQKAMSGELDFFEALNDRVALLKGMPLKLAKEVCESLPYMHGATQLISNLKERGKKVVVFSGGFHLATDFAKTKLGFDESYANILHHKNDVLTGLVGGEMMFSSSKGDMIARLQRLLDINPYETVCVGDGANDISMFAHSKTSIAFCAKPVLKEYATHIVDTKDLTKLIEIIR